MALTESDIKIIIAAELKKAGFDKAQKATTSLEKSFKRLGKTATRTFVAVAGVRALKQAVIGFAEEERAAIRLAGSLRNLGLAYNTKAIEDYLEQTEKATGINKDELSPAIQGLITTTLSAEKSIKMLGIAMDISAATGKDLQSVTVALSRAYSGNFAALGKIQTAYTSAELKALGFDNALNALADNFSGAAGRNADSYAGKIDKLRIAFGDARDEIGKGIVTFLESLGDGNYDQGLQRLVDFGTAIGNAFRRAGVTIEYTKALLSTGFRIDEEEMRKLEEIRNRFENPQAAANRTANSPAANRMFLNDLRKQQTLQKKIEQDRKKAAALAAKAEREKAQLKRAGTVFDLENIQIVAALQGKIDEEQRLRLNALLALNTGNAKAAEEMTKAILAANAAAFDALGVTLKAGDNVDTLIKKIIDAQAKLFLVNTGLADIKEAKNPFDKWPDIIAAILAGIADIGSAINNLPTAPGNPLTNAPAAPSRGNNNPMSREEWEAFQNRLPPELRESYEDYLKVFNNNAANNPLVNRPTVENPGADLPIMPDTSLPSPGAGDQQVLSISVNVNGSIITENDLVSSITNAIYNRQKSGQPITYSTSI